MTFEPNDGQLVYGKIEVVDNPHTDGESTEREVVFCFNPAKLAYSAQAKWEQPSQSGKKGPSEPSFKGAEPRTMKIELLLDGWDLSGSGHSAKRDIDKDLKTLASWTIPTADSVKKNKPRPPTVRLAWGKQWFPAYVTQVDTTITMFRPDGHPLRATVNVSLKEFPKPVKPGNPTSGSRVGHDSHLLVEGEDLASVAQKVYDAPKYWRAIANANGIDDPTRLRVGTLLYLPPIEDLSGLS
jgi:nucleoid-associated protein YgaU